MDIYKQMYLHLFNSVTNALEHIEAQNFGLAKEALIAAQQKCEEMFLESEE